jgi:hypothetical protein
MTTPSEDLTAAARRTARCLLGGRDELAVQL